MRHIKSCGIIFVLLLSVTSILRGEFIYGGIGARASGMGKAYVAISDDADAIFYNPAGLGISGRQEFNATYQRLFTGIAGNSFTLFTASSVLPFNKLGNFGAAITNFNVESYRETQVLFGYARHIFADINVGVSVKLQSWGIQGFEGKDPTTNTFVTDKDITSTSLSADMGVYYILRPGGNKILTLLLGKGDLMLGMALRDFIRPNISENGDDGGKLPVTLDAGFAYRLESVLIGVSCQQRGGYSDLHLGMEYYLPALKTPIGTTRIVLRGGGIPKLTGDSSSEYMGGFGLQHGKFQFDYTLSQNLLLPGLGNTHKAALGYQF